jgi:hypothetical protein
MIQKSLALIGNASGRTVLVGRTKSIRGVFDKETRRKPLARRTRAYGVWMAAWSRIARPEGTVGVRKLAGNHGWSGERVEWKVGKGEIARRWRHECVGVLRYIQESLPTELLGRIEVRTY